MGEEGQGWQIAMTTLQFERGATGGQAGGLSSMFVRVGDVVELARRAKRDGRPAIEDPLIRDQLVRFLIEEEGDRLCPRACQDPGIGGRATARDSASPGSSAAPSIAAASSSSPSRSRGRAVRSGWGDPQAADGGKWQRSYFNAFSGTIGGGTSQIQANIVGERVLGLDKS